ncbi:hypothetical protein [Aquimarina agarilytica]|uniref:hypothetical protein n=1 Tax=Aquimarina agarilytica TaxID=1087449 RepID=UPI000287FFFF|nr:hypothetical protein [Aquimarina agarilytica]
MIFNIACIASGILLAMATLDKWDGDKDYFKKAGNFLIPYNTAIGGVLLALGIIHIIQPGCLIYDIIAIAGGLLLLMDIVGKAPAIGSLLVKASNALLPFKVAIGLTLLVIGVTNLLGLHLLC